MVTELEMGDASYAAGARYVLRYHKADKSAMPVLDIGSSGSESWTGFRYRNTQWSFVKFAAKPGTVIGLV
jgi:hypothetical protein